MTSLTPKDGGAAAGKEEKMVYGVAYVAAKDHANAFKYGVKPEWIVTIGRGDPFRQLEDVREIIERGSRTNSEKVEAIEDIFNRWRDYESADGYFPLMAEGQPEGPRTPSSLPFRSASPLTKPEGEA